MSKKTPAQHEREIAQIIDGYSSSSLPSSATRGTAHSAKALTTLARMRTAPDQWGITPIDWVEEEREVAGLVPCPTCHGRKFVLLVDGQVVPRPGNTPDSFSYDKDASRESRRSGKFYGNCPTCGVQKRGWGIIPQGKVKGRVTSRVMVGYPRFPPGTVFDSQYAAGMRCHLCNKTILKSNRVPVHAVDDAGVTHGMFVGEDCARKFLGVRLARESDSIMEAGS